MATLVMMSVFDTKTGYHNAPFFVPHVEVGFRAMRDLCNDLATTVGRHPADYCLFILGAFNDQTGLVDTTTATNLGPCTQFVNAPAAGRLFPTETPNRE